MDSYISCLLDYKADFNEKIIIFKAPLIILKRLVPYTGGEIEDNKLYIKNPRNFYEKYAPIEKYEEYFNIYKRNLWNGIPRPELNHQYLAALFDLFASFRVESRGSFAHAEVLFIKKKIIPQVCQILRKKYKKPVQIVGKELVYMLENIQKDILLKYKESEIILEILSNTLDLDSLKKWEIFKKEQINL